MTFRLSDYGHNTRREQDSFIEIHDAVERIVAWPADGGDVMNAHVEFLIRCRVYSRDLRNIEYSLALSVELEMVSRPKAKKDRANS